jgi:hypothetical protein
MDVLERDFTADRPGLANYIVDGNALLQAQITLPETFKDLAASIFAQLPKRVDFVTDSYFPLSIKGIERERRGSSKVHLLKGPKMKVPRDWKAFMSCHSNSSNSFFHSGKKIIMHQSFRVGRSCLSVEKNVSALKASMERIL